MLTSFIFSIIADQKLLLSSKYEINVVISKMSNHMCTYCSKNAAKLLPFCFHIQINSTDYKSHYNRNLVTYCSRVNYFFRHFPFSFFGDFMFIFFLILLLRFRIRSSPNFYLECFIHSSHIRGFLC